MFQIHICDDLANNVIMYYLVLKNIAQDLQYYAFCILYLQTMKIHTPNESLIKYWFDENKYIFAEIHKFHVVSTRFVASI